MRLSKKVAAVSNECVACGSCEKVCPLGAISIFRGLYALWIGINALAAEMPEDMSSIGDINH